MEMWVGGYFFLLWEGDDGGEITHFDFDFVVDVFVCHLFFSLFSFLFFWENGCEGRGRCGCDGVWSVGGRSWRQN